MLCCSIVNQKLFISWILLVVDSQQSEKHVFYFKSLNFSHTYAYQRMENSSPRPKLMKLEVF